MKDKKYIALLKQYRTGTISDTDRHLLEQAALDDPFLFDAMEGYGVYGSTDDAKAIEDLSKKSKKDTKVIGFNRRWIGIAASLIALMAITFLVKNSLDTDVNKASVAVTDKTNKPPNEEQIAQAIPEQKPQSTANSTSVNNEEEVEESEVLEDEQESEASEVKTKNTKNKSTARPDKLPPPPPVSITKEVNPDTKKWAEEAAKKEGSEINNEKPNKDGATLSEEKSREEKEKVVAPNTGKSVKKEDRPEEDAISYADVENESNYILGKVLNADGEELIGVNVYIANTEIGDVSDIDGNFKLPKYERGHQMVISYVGYKDQKVVLGDMNYYQIVLQPKEDLSEVKAAPLKEVGIQNAYPSMGLGEFDTYIKDNIRHPLEVFGNSKSRKVIVGFEVDMSGNLSNFVDKSKNCTECFKEAVRLLEGSGRWETKPFGTAYRTSYVFEF